MGQQHIPERLGTGQNPYGWKFSTWQAITFFALFFGYVGYYLCRSNLEASSSVMIDKQLLTKETYGWIASVSVWVYALSKFSSGILTDSVLGGRKIFFLGLAGSAVATFAFGLGQVFWWFLAFACINRFFQSMGWVGMLKILAVWFKPSQQGTTIGIISGNYLIGDVLARALISGLIALGVTWSWLFFTPAAVLAFMGTALYYILKESPTAVGYAIPQDQITPAVPEAPATATKTTADEPVVYKQILISLLKNPFFWAICFLSFTFTLLRLTFNTWSVVFFNDMGSSNSGAVFKSTVFPLLGFVGSTFAGWYSDRFSHARRAPIMCFMVFGLSLTLILLAYAQPVQSWLLATCHIAVSQSTLAVILIAMAGFLLLGPYSMMGGVCAVDMGGAKAASTAAGIIDGIGYLGGSLAGLGVAKIVGDSSDTSKNADWAFVFQLMAAIAVVSLMVTLFLWKVQPKDMQK